MDRAAVAAVAALDDDVRRALYEVVRNAPGPVTREEAARAVGISRKLAAFHLDKLVDLGLLRSRFDAGPTRRVGRAPRVYEPGSTDVVVRLPAREPEVLAAILIDALAEERADSGAQAAIRVAREHGFALGEAERARLRPGRIGVERASGMTAALLARTGFEPYREGAALRLRNCPFHPLAARAPELVCGINHAYLGGVLEGLGVAHRLDAALTPRPGECCVELRDRSAASETGVTPAS